MAARCRARHSRGANLLQAPGGQCSELRSRWVCGMRPGLAPPPGHYCPPQCPPPASSPRPRRRHRPPPSSAQLPPAHLLEQRREQVSHGVLGQPLGQLLKERHAVGACTRTEAGRWGVGGGQSGSRCAAWLGGAVADRSMCRRATWPQPAARPLARVACLLRLACPAHPVSASLLPAPLLFEQRPSPPLPRSTDGPRARTWVLVLRQVLKVRGHLLARRRRQAAVLQCVLGHGGALLVARGGGCEVGDEHRDAADLALGFED